MAEVRIHPADELDWKNLGDLYPPEQAKDMSPADRQSSLCDHEQGLDGSLHLQEFRFLPGARVDLHAHDMAEIIYVVEGTLHFGNRELASGSSVYVGAETLYGFTAGNGGCRLLIFMQDGTAQYWFEKEFRERQAEGRQSTSAV